MSLGPEQTLRRGVLWWTAERPPTFRRSLGPAA